jgi:hypothetical protein
LSSVSEFGPTAGIVNEDSEPNPVNAYGEMKLSLRCLHQKLVKNCTTHFLSGIAGNGMPPTFLHKFVSEVLIHGHSLSVNNHSHLFNGCYRVDTYMKELVQDAVLIAQGHEALNRVVHASEPKTWEQLTNQLHYLMNKSYHLAADHKQTPSLIGNTIYNSSTFAPRCTTLETLSFLYNVLSTKPRSDNAY